MQLIDNTLRVLKLEWSRHTCNPANSRYLRQLHTPLIEFEDGPVFFYITRDVYFLIINQFANIWYAHYNQ